MSELRWMGVAESCGVRRLRHLQPSEGPMKPYASDVPKKPPEPQAPEPYEAIPDLIRDLLREDEGMVMVTSWAVVCEYVADDGVPGFAAWSSNDPPWRIQGLMSHGADLLDMAMTEYADDSEDD